MTDIQIPEGLPAWIREHVALYLADGAADSSGGAGPGLRDLNH